MVEATTAETLGQLLDDRATSAQRAHDDAGAAVERAAEAAAQAAAVLRDVTGQCVLAEADVHVLADLAAAGQAYLKAVEDVERATAAAAGVANRVSRTVGDQQRQLLLAGAAGAFYGNPGSTPAGVAATTAAQSADGSTLDRLKVSGRAQLADGEQVLGSGYVADSEGVLAVAFGVRGPDGPHVRLGLGIYPEDKKSWRGANLGATVVLDPAGVGQVSAAVAAVVAKAKTKAAEFLALCKRMEAAQNAVAKLERRRFHSESAAELRTRLEQRIRDEGRTQKWRRAELDEIEAGFDPGTRAALEVLQRQAEAAPLADRGRLRKAQQVTASGLTEEEFDELCALDGLSSKDINTAARWRPKDEIAALRAGRARLDELAAKARARTTSPWGGYRLYMDAYHTGEAQIADLEAQLAALDAQARPLSTDQAAALYDARAEQVRLEDEHDQVAGLVCVTETIPGGWGEVVVEATLDEERWGAVSYCMAVRPYGAPESWAANANSDPFRPSPAVMRKLAALLRGLLP